MSTDPSLALAKAIIAKINGDDNLQSLLTGRIYDRVPDGPTFPYVKIGEDQDVPDLAEGINGSEIFLNIHIWSRAVGFPECKRIANALSTLLHETDLALDENTFKLIERHMLIYRTDPDGLTSHGILTLRALTEPNDAEDFTIGISSIGGPDPIG